MINRIKNGVKYRVYAFLQRYYPYFWVRILYRLERGDKLNLTNPRDINEKILWLSWKGDTKLWPLLADKFAVREYVASRIGEEYLIPLLGKWDNAENIDFDQLPNKFVIKPNNGSYNVIVVPDKASNDVEDIRKQLSKSLSKAFGISTGEHHYRNIKPCIIAETLLETSEVGGLKDYKIWCFDGKPYSIMVCMNREVGGHHVDYIQYDLDWQRHQEYIPNEYRNDCECGRPKNLEQMLQLASKLSKGLPQCRVDLYNVEGKIYFGEMTLTSNYGMDSSYTDEFLAILGKQCILPKRSFSEKMRSVARRYLPFGIIKSWCNI